MTSKCFTVLTFLACFLFVEANHERQSKLFMIQNLTSGKHQHHVLYIFRECASAKLYTVEGELVMK